MKNRKNRNLNYTMEELKIVKELAELQIKSLLALQKNRDLLSYYEKKLKEELGEDGEDISKLDFYEDIAESLSIWETIHEDPQKFTDHKYQHNLTHIETIMRITMATMPDIWNPQAVEKLLTKLAIHKHLFHANN